MNLRALVDEVANDADEFLAAVENRKAAREAISDYAHDQYPELSRKEHADLISAVLAILDEEGFFGGGGSGDSWETDDDDVDDN